MKRNPAAWATLGLLALFAALTFWLAQVVEAPQQKNDGSTRHDPDYIVENFSAQQMAESGLPRYAIAATRMTHYPDDETTHLERPHFTRFGGEAPIHALSQHGTLSKDGKEAYLQDNVQLIREAYAGRSEFVLRTSYLRILPDEERAETDKAVAIDDGDTHITAIGLKLDAKTRQFKFLSRVKVRYENPRK